MESDNQRAFNAMVLKGMDLGQPKHYVEDLHVHDRITLGLGRIPEPVYSWQVPDGCPFAWIVRDCGTELIYIGSPTADKDESPSIMNLATLSYYETGGFGHDNVTCWWWDGLGPGLVQIRLEQVRGKLFEAFYHYERKQGGRRVHSLPVPAPRYDSFGQLIRPLAS